MQNGRLQEPGRNAELIVPAVARHCSARARCHVVVITRPPSFWAQAPEHGLPSRRRPQEQWVCGTLLRVSPRRLGSRLLALGLVAATGSACVSFSGPGRSRAGSSAHPPHARGPSISGRIFGADGKPASGMTVRAVIHLSNSETDSRAIKELFTAGLGCLDAQGCSEPRVDGVVAGNGAFAIPLPSRATVSSNDPVLLIVVSHLDATSRVVVSIKLPQLGTPHLDVGRIDVPVGAPRLEAHALVMPSLPGVKPPTTIAYSEGAGLSAFLPTVPVVEFRNGRFDARVVEDGQALLVAQQITQENGYPTTITGSLRLAGDGSPPSRGAPCYVRGRGSQQVRQQPCTITNGPRERSHILPNVPECGPACGIQTPLGLLREVTVVLPKRQVSDLLVVHGCGRGCSVDYSSDGRNFGGWFATAETNPDAIVLLPLWHVPVTAVRVRTYDVYRLTQVSIW